MRFGHRFESRYGSSRSTLNDDLIAAWPLDEASGTRYADYGGSAFDLTEVDGVGTADAPSGIGGLCANLNGSSEYLYCADPFAPPSALSITAWVYPLSVSGADIIVSQDRVTTGSDRAFGLYLSNGVITSYLSVNGTAVVNAAAGAALSTSAWAQAALVWNGSTITSYRNTVAGTPAAFATSAYWNSAEPLRIGAHSISGVISSFFHGRIAQPLIWSRTLTAAEIAYLYNSGSGRPLSDWLA